MTSSSATDASRHVPLCAAPYADHEPAAFSLPEGACDTHAHVVSGDPRHRLVGNRSYTPPAAPEDAYLRMLEDTGMSRGVLVQISVYGTDNHYMLQVLDRHPEQLRGIAVVDPAVETDTLVAMHDAGVRGLRINVLFGGGVGWQAMEELAAKIAHLGWHLQLLLDVRELPDLLPRVSRLPVPVVVDHLGHMPAELGPRHPGFQALLTLLTDHEAWVKLSGAYRIDAQAPEYPAARVLAEAVLQAAPGRVVYGSDWPHVAVPHEMPNTGGLRNLLATWIPDEDLRRRVLVNNPAELYGFPPVGEPQRGGDA
ncbi:MAG TPA: amidohydrolase family protein [Marmoricola sp.]